MSGGAETVLPVAFHVTARCTASGGLRLRAQPNTDSPVVGSVANGATVSVINTCKPDHKWVCVQPDPSLPGIAFAHGDYLEVVDGDMSDKMAECIRTSDPISPAISAFLDLLFIVEEWSPELVREGLDEAKKYLKYAKIVTKLVHTVKNTINSARLRTQFAVKCAENAGSKCSDLTRIFMEAVDATVEE